MTGLAKLAVVIGTLCLVVALVNHAAPKSPESQIPAGCPIHAITTGMTINEAQRALPSYRFDYRGEHQDTSVYHIDAGICAAFLDFDFKDHGLNVIQYDNGPILYREKLITEDDIPRSMQTRPSQPAIPEWQPQDPRLPDFADGE